MTSAKQIITLADAVKISHRCQALSVTNISVDTNGRLLYARAETTQHDGSTQIILKRAIGAALTCEEIVSDGRGVAKTHPSKPIRPVLDALSNGLTRRIEREARISALVSHENARAITGMRMERLSGANRAVESAILDARVDAAEDALKMSTAR